MSNVGERFEELLQRIETAVKSLLKHDEPEIQAVATDVIDVVKELRDPSTAAEPAPEAPAPPVA